MSKQRSTTEMISELLQILQTMPKDSEYRKELEQMIQNLIDEDKLKNGNGGIA